MIRIVIIVLKLMIDCTKGLKAGIGPFCEIELRDVRPSSKAISVRAFDRNAGRNAREEC
jgi:hypothetical protein